MSKDLNIGSDGVKIEYEDTSVEFDYTENQIIIEDINSEETYSNSEFIEKDEESIEFFIEQIINSLPEESSTNQEGNKYRIEVIGDLPGRDTELSEVYKGKARVESGIHEEDGFPIEAYRLWQSLSNKAKNKKVKAD
jgi:hypothetical protein